MHEITFGVLRIAWRAPSHALKRSDLSFKPPERTLICTPDSLQLKNLTQGLDQTVLHS